MFKNTWHNGWNTDLSSVIKNMYERKETVPKLNVLTNIKETVTQMPSVSSPKTPEETYANWVKTNGIDADQRRAESMSALQSMYDKSIAGYGATAETLRQMGLSSSGLAAAYQNIADQGYREGRLNAEKQYKTDVQANKSAFDLYKQGIQSKATEFSAQNTEADVEELTGYLTNLYGLDPITARQMASNAFNATRGEANRVNEANRQQAYSSAFDASLSMLSDGLNVDAALLAKRFGIDEETAGQALTDAGRSLGVSISPNGITTPVEKDIAAEYQSLTEGDNPIASTHEDAIAILKKKGYKDEDLKPLNEAYQKEVDKENEFITDVGASMEDIVRNANLDNSKGITDFIYDIASLGDERSNELARSLNAIRNEDGTYDNAQVVDLVWRYAAATGNKDVINNVGDAAVQYNIDAFKDIGGKTKDGMNVIDLANNILAGEWNDGSTESINRQLDMLFENGMIESELNGYGTVTVSRTERKSSKPSEKSSYLSNISIDFNLGGDKRSLRLDLYKDNPYEEVINSAVDNPKNGDFAAYTDDKGKRHLFVYVDAPSGSSDRGGRPHNDDLSGWKWIEKEDATSVGDDLADEDWEKLWTVLARRNDITLDTTGGKALTDTLMKAYKAFMKNAK